MISDIGLFQAPPRGRSALRPHASQRANLGFGFSWRRYSHNSGTSYRACRLLAKDQIHAKSQPRQDRTNQMPPRPGLPFLCAITAPILPLAPACACFTTPGPFSCPRPAVAASARPGRLRAGGSDAPQRLASRVRNSAYLANGDISATARGERDFWSIRCSGRSMRKAAAADTPRISAM
jgi:hypothetical protein